MIPAPEGAGDFRIGVYTEKGKREKPIYFLLQLFYNPACSQGDGARRGVKQIFFRETRRRAYIGRRRGVKSFF